MELPSEIWSVIFSFCDGKSLASSVCCVCTKFRKLEGDETLWKSKCTERKLDASFKKPGETWKQFYFFQPLQLFPLYGITINKTTGDELKAIPGVVMNTPNYATLNRVNFWFNNEGEIFNMMYLVNGIYIIPKEWEDIGINYKRSWNGYLTYLKYYNHNYQITDLPGQNDFQGNQCFTAAVQTICKSDDVYFQVVFSFEYHEGDENSKNTLYSISIQCDSEENGGNFKELYENKVIENQGYVIKDEQNQFEILRKELIGTAPKLKSVKLAKLVLPKVIPPVSAMGIVIPTDIWTVIFDHCDARSIATTLPLVCKTFKQLSDDDALWKKKCSEIERDPNTKLPDETWKQYYFTKHLALFPLYGMTIEKTTEAELLQHRDAVKANDGDYFTIKKTNFWVNNHKREFCMMYIARGVYPIPREWAALGMNWERSFADYLVYLKRSTGNYQINQAPKQRYVLQRTCFEATVETVLRHDDIYYRMALMFGYTEGTATSTSTLYSISIRSASSDSDRNTWRQLYDDHVIEHKEEDLTPPIPEPDAADEDDLTQPTDEDQIDF